MQATSNIVKQKTNVVASARTLTTWIYGIMVVCCSRSLTRCNVRSRT